MDLETADMLDVDPEITGENVKLVDIAARARTLGLEPGRTPDIPEGIPAVINFDAETASAMAKLPQSMADQTHAERVRTGLEPDQTLVPSPEEMARYAEDREAVSEWREKYLISRTLMSQLADQLKIFVELLGGSVGIDSEPEDLFGPASTAQEALRVLKMNWDSIQPQLATQAAAQTPVEVPVDGRSEPGTAE